MNAIDDGTILWTSGEAQAADRHTLSTLQVPSAVLMERAALVVAHELRERLSGRSVRLDVVCGPGNNGADGLALSRIVHGWGWAVTAHLATPTRNEAAEAQLALARAHGVSIEASAGGAVPPAGIERIVVDALLGTGTSGAPRGAVAEALTWAQGMPGFRVAIDVPTGVDPDTGVIRGNAFEAELTVTFGRSKPGLHVTPGRAFAGEIVVGDIGLVAAPELESMRGLITPDAVQAVLAGLPDPAHKGVRGHVGIIGGSARTPGAAVLAGTAALRTGAGLVTLATQDDATRRALVELRPELMLADVGSFVPDAGALVLGPGLTELADRFGLEALYLDDVRPMVVDASGLELVHVPGGPDERPRGPRILTPHPGEAASLLRRIEAKTEGSANAAPSSEPEWTAARVQDERIAVAERLAAALGAVVVLKGAGTLVASPDGRIAIATVGSSALATAGTGDVLAGVIGAFAGRGLEAFFAATTGVMVHAVAGELATARRPGGLALDVADATTEALSWLRSGVRSGVPGGAPRMRRG